MSNEIDNRIKKDAARIVANYMANKDEGAFRKELQQAWEKQPEELFLAGEHGLIRLTRDSYYQQLVLEINKGIDLFGRSVLRDEIQKVNETVGEKKIMTPEEIKLKDLRRRLDEIKKAWERPHGKYDTGIAHTALRMIANVQKVITEAFQVLKNGLERAGERKDIEPFYDLIKDAYQDKGRMLAEALAKGEIDKKEAKDIFIKDMAFIRTQKVSVRSEIQEAYAKSLTEAMKGKDVPIQAKNTVLEIVMEYQKGNYNQQIREYAKNGFSWNTKKRSRGREAEKEQNKERQNKENQNRESKNRESQNKGKQDNQPNKEEAKQKGNPTLEERFPYASCAIDAIEAGKSINIDHYKKAEDVMQAFADNLSEFHHKHPDLTKKESELFTKVAVSALMTYQYPGERIWKGIEKQITKYDSKGFRSTSATSRTAVLLDAAAMIDAAARAGVREQDVNAKQFEDARDMANGQAQMTMKDALVDIPDREQRQNFISGIADQVSSSSAQYLFAMDARLVGFRAQIHDGRGAEAKMRHMAHSMANKYMGQDLQGSSLTTLESFIAFCDRMPESLGGAQAVYEMVKEELGNSVLALGKLENDREAYNDMNEEQGFEKIVSIETTWQEKENLGREGAFAGEAAQPEIFDDPKTDYEAWDSVLRGADDWLDR